VSRNELSQRLQGPRSTLATAGRRCLDPTGRRGRLAAEQEARAGHAMPSSHPEHLTRRLRRRHERLLKDLAAKTWPRNEYELEL